MNILKSAELLQVLEDKIPLREPDLRWNEKDFAFYAGQRAVINLIKSMLEDEAKSIPEVATTQ